jgi:hemolysin III
MNDSSSSTAPKSKARFSYENEWQQAFFLNDEWANYLTHGFALLLSILGGYFLIKLPFSNGDFSKMIIFGVYAITLILMYGTSTIYHYLHDPTLKKRFRLLDHCAIYLFIAGSYTPFTLILMKEDNGLLLFSIIWGMTCLGIAFKVFFNNRFKILSVLFYVTMGWLVIFSTESLFARLHMNGIYWLFAGGLCYTTGVIFYLLDRKRFFHAIWHLFTLSGSICHYICILFYI